MGSEPDVKKQMDRYIDLLERAGADVKILPWTKDQRKIKWYIYQCDGFLFPDGNEIDLKAVKGLTMEQGNLNAQIQSDHQGEIRDQFEFFLLQNILLTNKPILAVGRGMNLLNLVQGGTLEETDRAGQTIARPGRGIHLEKDGEKNQFRLESHVFCVGVEAEDILQEDGTIGKQVEAFLNACPYNQALLQRFSAYPSI